MCVHVRACTLRANQTLKRFMIHIHYWDCTRTWYMALSLCFIWFVRYAYHADRGVFSNRWGGAGACCIVLSLFWVCLSSGPIRSAFPNLVCTCRGFRYCSSQGMARSSRPFAIVAVLAILEMWLLHVLVAGMMDASFTYLSILNVLLVPAPQNYL